MDRFNSLASQAKAKAEQGRVAATQKLDTYQRGRSSSGSAQESPAAAAAPPPAPPSRSSGPPPPRSTGSATGSVFVGINDQEKRAFFGLLDEYFASRPQYKELFASSAPSSGPPPAARRSPVPAPPAAVPSPPPMRARGLGTATALYTFEGQDPAEDLSFQEGDKILVLEHVSEDWWKGELNGRTGIFPSSYAQMS